MAKNQSQEPSVFTKIINRELPSTIRYEDDEFIVIDSIAPVAPFHFLVIPKQPYQTLEDVDTTDTTFHARILQVARLVAKKYGFADNYKLFMNVGSRVQAIQHIHLHVTGGWDASVTREELENVGVQLHTDGLK